MAAQHTLARRALERVAYVLRAGERWDGVSAKGVVGFRGCAKHAPDLVGFKAGAKLLRPGSRDRRLAVELETLADRREFKNPERVHRNRIVTPQRRQTVASILT